MTPEPKPSDACERKCFDCGNVAMHKAAYTPWVLCSKCGSQDTRLTKRPAPTREQQLETTVAELVGLLREQTAMIERQRDFNDDSDGMMIERSNAAIAKHGGEA